MAKKTTTTKKTTVDLEQGVVIRDAGAPQNDDLESFPAQIAPVIHSVKKGAVQGSARHGRQPGR